MTMPTPFESGRNFANQLGRGITEARDVSTIDRILEEASQSEDPEAINRAMLGILKGVSPAKQEQAFALLQNKANQIAATSQAKSQRNAFESLGLNPELANLDKGLQKEIVKSQLNPKSSDNTANLEGAERALDELDAFVAQPGIGFVGTHFNAGSKARFNRGKFDATLASVLPVFKSLFPRGMTEKEFLKVMQEFLPQHDDSEAKIRGKLAGLRGMLKQANPQGKANANANPDQNAQTVEMRDANGDTYDIPSNLVEQARAQGLK
jgi:hypothetical protein